MIWRIGSPSALFRRRRRAAAVEAASAKKKHRIAAEARFDAARVSLWARARVDVEVAGKPTPGGISELVFMPDGALAMTSTPSTADGDAGALWRVDRPEAGVLSPRLVQRFPGLKPEGISPSLTPGTLMIVFDAGSATPSFQELSWGRVSQRRAASAIARMVLCAALSGCSSPPRPAASDRAIALYREGRAPAGAPALRRAEARARARERAARARRRAR